jgi:hypothetical protein
VRVGDEIEVDREWLKQGERGSVMWLVKGREEHGLGAERNKKGAEKKEERDRRRRRRRRRRGRRRGGEEESWPEEEEGLLTGERKRGLFSPVLEIRRGRRRRGSSRVWYIETKIWCE